MSTLISMVGQQPAAIATTAKTLLMHCGLERVILLPTEKTKFEFNRLERYLRESLHIPAELIDNPCFISTDIHKPQDGYALVWEAIKKCLDRGDLSQPVYFDTSPGLNYQTALISYHLKDDRRFEPIYADNKKLHDLTNGASWDLEHIGFKELLELYGLREKNGKEPDPGDAVHDIVIVGGKEQLPLVSACEKYGRLYGLYKIWNLEGLKGKEKENEDARVKQEARKIESLEETPQKFNYLRLKVIVWTNKDIIRHRLHASGISTIGKNFSLNNILEEFRKIINENPGDVSPGSQSEPLRFAGKCIEKSNPGGDWQGHNLIVTLGSDPDATLKALFTHKPQECIILVDEENPLICVLAARINEQSINIPAKKITFWPMDLMGNIRCRNQIIACLKNGDWALNITPGTKVHSWHFARLPVNSLWSLYDKYQRVESLIANTSLSPIPYGFPPITVQASIIGGRLFDEGTSMVQLLEKQGLLSNICKVIALIMRNTSMGVPPKESWPKPLVWAPGVKIVHDHGNYIKCIQIYEKNEQVEFEASFNGQKEQGWIKSLPHTGHWFEEAVAGAFLDAGGSEIEDMRVGLRWDWLHKNPDGVHFRNDLDVVVLWKGHYIGISCKTGSDDATLEMERPAVIAVTRTGLGRFALPAIVRSGVKPKLAVKKAETSLKTEPMEVGMSLLSEKSNLNLLINKHFIERRTVT